MAKLKIALPGRTDIQYIDVAKLHIDYALNSRKFLPSTDRIRSLAVDIIEKGQIQPIEIRKLADDVYAPISGYTRCKAVDLINTDPELRMRANLSDDGVFPVKCVVTRANERDSFLRSVSENHERSDTSYVDDAYAQNILRERYGMSNVEIAQVYGCTPAWIGELSKILDLDDDHQRLLHDEALSVRNAVDLTRILPEKRRELVEQATIQPNLMDNETAQMNSVNEAGEKKQEVKIDNRQLAKDIGIARNKPRGRTMKEARDAFTAVAQDKEIHSMRTRSIIGSLLQFFAGEAELEDVLDAIEHG